jgi:hypothetical protein
MPDGLTGRAAAALAPPPDFSQLARTASYVPSPTDVQMPGAGIMPGMPGAGLNETRPDLAQALPLIIGRARQIAAQSSQAQAQPTQAPAPAGQDGGLLQNILGRLLQGVQVGISNDPGAALNQLIQSRQADATRREDQARQERLQREQEQRDFERQITSVAINEDLTSRREDRAEERARAAAEDQFRRQVGLQKIETADRRSLAEFEAKWKTEQENLNRQSAIDAARLKAADNRGQTVFEKSQPLLAYTSRPDLVLQANTDLFDNKKPSPEAIKELNATNARMMAAARAAQAAKYARGTEAGFSSKMLGDVMEFYLKKEFVKVPDGKGGFTVRLAPSSDVETIQLKNAGAVPLSPQEKQAYVLQNYGMQVMTRMPGAPGAIPGPTQGGPATAGGQTVPANVEAIKNAFSQTIQQQKSSGASSAEIRRQLSNAPQPEGIDEKQWFQIRSQAIREIDQAFAGQKQPAELNVLGRALQNLGTAPSVRPSETGLR